MANIHKIMTCRGHEIANIHKIMTRSGHEIVIFTKNDMARGVRCIDIKMTGL